MAEYKDIHGTNIEVVSSDPSNPINGQVWYNTTSQTLKGLTSNPVGSWATGNAMNNNRRGIASAVSGTQTAAFKVHSSTHELYNGSSWTETTDINSARYRGGSAGTNTGALFFGGSAPPSHTYVGKTESWNGSAWTEVNDMNTAREINTGAGATKFNKWMKKAGLVFNKQTGRWTRWSDR